MNLIGDHTDYNQGFVLPVAIDRACVVAAVPADTVRVASLDVGGSVEIPPDGGHELADDAPSWARLATTVTQELAALGRPALGLDAVVATDVPIGSGLSSSAAFEVALAVALAGVAGWDAEPVDLALACRAAEERALGVPCGVMDQLTALAGREACAILIDCRSLETTSIPLPPDMAILVIHSGQSRALATSAYAERRRACERLAAELGLEALRDASPGQVAGEPIGRHVVGENERVLGAAEALREGDLERLGALFRSSHTSLRGDFGVSTPELDALVDALVEAGAYGARLTGAGFGGSVVAVCDRSLVHDVAERASARYRTLTGLEPTPHVCRAVEGAGRLDQPSSSTR